MHLYNFAYQLLLADAHDIEHIRVAHAFRDDQRSRYPDYSASGHALATLLKQYIHANRALDGFFKVGKTKPFTARLAGD